MITLTQFSAYARQHLRRPIDRNLNASQYDAITAAANQSLFLVAGPGSGKTTVIALRVLRLIFVDGAPPESVLATTFTRKAAAELRSRILGWGDQLREGILTGANAELRARLIAVDLNKVRCGTIDSLAEDVLTEHRAAGQTSPTVVEDFVAGAHMLREGLFGTGLLRDQDVETYVLGLTGSNFINTPGKAATLRSVSDRCINDLVDIQAYRIGSPTRGVANAFVAIDAYRAELVANGLYDFASLQKHFLDRMAQGTLQGFLSTLCHVLVDEYQDTNHLQEQIYFSMGQAAVAAGGSFTVVGDDDQSLYRFRGATVDLFHGFATRAQTTGMPTQTIYLSQNYRSSPSIVGFVNDYVTLDAGYQLMRVAGKPPIVSSRQMPLDLPTYPVLGMFRDTLAELGKDLSNFIGSVIQGNGVTLPGFTEPIRIHPRNGSAADVALLMSSPQERKSSGEARLPLLVRNNLAARPRPIRVFNPRGQSFHTITTVRRLCGLLLECIDPAGLVQGQIQNLPPAANQVLTEWRQDAREYMNSSPTQPFQELCNFVGAWQARRPLRRTARNRVNVGLNEIVYSLVTWIPEMQQDVEHLAYLECVARAVSQSAQFSAWGGTIVFEPTNGAGLSQLAASSVRSALWDIITPIADGAIEINEDLLVTLPPDRMPVMSIHQSKGLEFPLTIVDVGSDFSRNHHTQAFKRFPNTAPPPCRQEDELRPFSTLPRQARSGTDRAFDDLIRQYFVAFSRAADVLLLVGLSCNRAQGIPNIATGWDRNRNWHWAAGLNNLTHI